MDSQHHHETQPFLCVKYVQLFPDRITLNKVGSHTDVWNYWNGVFHVYIVWDVQRAAQRLWIIYNFSIIHCRGVAFAHQAPCLLICYDHQGDCVMPANIHPEPVLPSRLTEGWKHSSSGGNSAVTCGGGTKAKQLLMNVELSLFSLFSGRDGYWIQARRMQAYMPLKFTSQAKRIVCQVFNCCNHCLDQHLQRLHAAHNTWFCESLWDGLCWLLYFTCAGFFIFLCCAQRDHLRPVITYPQHILLLLYTMLFQSLISSEKNEHSCSVALGCNKVVYFFPKGWIYSH